MRTRGDGRNDTSTPGGTWVYRPRSSSVYAAILAVVLAGWTWSTLADGTFRPLVALPWLLFLATAGYTVFVRPRVEVDDAGVTLVNPLRTVVVPWPALVHVSTRYALTLHTPGGNHRAWAAPGPGRHAATMSTAVDVRAVSRTGGSTGSVGLGDLPSSPSGVAAHHVRERWQNLVDAGAVEAGVAEETPVRTRVAWPWVAALAVTALAGVGAALLG